jgi:OFA family oxalate/formate antiporter-like MFS transporter
LYEASGKSYALPFTVLAVVALVALLLPLITRMPSAPVVRGRSQSDRRVDA